MAQPSNLCGALTPLFLPQGLLPIYCTHMYFYTDKPLIFTMQPKDMPSPCHPTRVGERTDLHACSLTLTPMLTNAHLHTSVASVAPPSPGRPVPSVSLALVVTLTPMHALDQLCPEGMILHEREVFCRTSADSHLLSYLRIDIGVCMVVQGKHDKCEGVQELQGNCGSEAWLCSGGHLRGCLAGYQIQRFHLLL